MNEAPPARVKVLLVCLGNICRSPTAEAVLRHQIAEAGLANLIEVDSAGTGNWHCGNPPDPRSVEAAARRSYDLSHLRARQVSARDFAEFDHVLAMDRQNLAELRRLCPPEHRGKLGLFLEHGASGRDEVPDPYYSGSDGFELVLDLVEAASVALVARLREQHGLSAR